ncbi:unnamed protein product [Clavelina lepadiformis]|uniref:Sulfotransferase n=1 Tax=Clavelina lepadiformis TaxID=159417 RepID=A0ABP0FRH8_CLALP
MSKLTKSGGFNFAMDTESFQRVVEFLPKDERPDIATLLEERKSRYDNPRVTKLGGYRIPTPCNVDVIKWQHDNWNPSKDDVLIASFPKTGTTWLTAIVKNLIYNDDVEMMKLTKSITFLYSYLERGLPLKFEIMEKLPWKRKIWGTHLPAPLINMERLKKMDARC